MSTLVVIVLLLVVAVAVFFAVRHSLNDTTGLNRGQRRARKQGGK